MCRSLVALFLFYTAFGSVEIAWKNNLTVSNHDLKGRLTVLTSTANSISSIYNGISYYSLNYQASKGTASGDGVYGAAYTSINAPLSTFLTYFDVSAKWGGAGNPTGADVSGAANLIGAVYLGLVEVDENGNTLSFLKLKTFTWTLTDVVTKGPVKYATFTGTSSTSTNFSISFTFVASDSAGTLTNGGVVTPKSLETIINILNYHFTSATSKLRLIVGVGTASGTASVTAKQGDNWHRLTAGSGLSGVYFDGSTQAYVDVNGTTKTVSLVSTGAGSVDFDGAGFLGQLAAIKTAQKSLVVDYRLMNITFEQSDNITWDPAIGVSEPYSAGATLQIQAHLVAFASFLAFAFAKVL